MNGPIEVKVTWLKLGVVNDGDKLVNENSAPAEFLISDTKPEPEQAGTMIYLNPITLTSGTLWARSPMGNSYLSITKEE